MLKRKMFLIDEEGDLLILGTRKIAGKDDWGPICNVKELGISLDKYGEFYKLLNKMYNIGRQDVTRQLREIINE